MNIRGDFTTTVEKALSEIDPKWRDYNGLIVCGSHNPNDWDYVIEEIYRARELKVPFLGICLGHQLAAIEYARHVLGMVHANSEEFSDNPMFDYVVKKLPELKVGQHEGETYWNNYEVIEEVLKIWQKPDNFITCQYHPEYQSSKDNPHPLLLKFLYHARNASLEM